MGIGVSIFLIALGAILTFAVNYQVSGIDLDTVGWILMAVGGIGLIATLVFWSTRRRGSTVAEERRVYDDPGAPPL